MPRVARSDFNTTFFHVITQGINKNYIFENVNDIKYYIKICMNYWLSLSNSPILIDMLIKN